ncbi:MAG: class II aldolase/adducin family protein, partial [Deltaproteobacteria bacterium]|nr:class II aldolase/adducin family protein [Deltaproteobacteria bacterium]
MSTTANRAGIYRKFSTLGAAIQRVDGNNTHSGNLSLRDPEDPDVFYITASGSQSGALTPRDIVPLRFSRVSWGDARASSESNVHRRILSLPGVRACIHCHHILCTVITFDSAEKQIFLTYLGKDKRGREEFLFQPVDLFGAYAARGVKVGTYRQPVGSAEMEERVPEYLAESPLTLIRGHGPFCRGTSLEDCLYRLSVLEGSASLALNLRRRGVELGAIQEKIMTGGPDSVFPLVPRLPAPGEPVTCQIDDEATKADFAYWLHYNYNFRIGAYGTGSMSQKVTAGAMIYCPMSAAPEGMDFPLNRLSLEPGEGDTADEALHKLIYNN